MMNIILSFIVLGAMVPLVPGQNSCQSLADNLFNGNCKNFVTPCPSSVAGSHLIYHVLLTRKLAAPAALCVINYWGHLIDHLKDVLWPGWECRAC